MSTTQLFHVSPLTTALVIALSIPTSSLAANEVNTKETKNTLAVNDNESVITVTAPAVSPLDVATSLKTPRQPIPASDGSDYLKTIPGFSQIRNGGTNGDPVFRGMFGSRLRMLIDDGEILGACGGRMDAPSSYISPESYDVLSLVKGPQTVLWGPGNSAGTVRFERTRPQFEKPGAKGNVSTVVGSNKRWDGNADLIFGNELGYIRLIGNKSRSNDYRDGDGNRIPSKWDKWNTDIALGWTPDADTLLELSAGQGDGEARYATRGMDGSQFKRKNFGVRFEKSNIGEVFDKFETNFYYNYADHVMDNYSLRTAPLHMEMVSEPDRLTMGGRMVGTWIWEDFKLQSGIDMQTNTHRSNTDRYMDKTKRVGWVKNARFRDYGIFGELTWDAAEQSKVIGGVRLDRVQVYKYSTQQERKDTIPAGFVRFEHNMKGVPVMFYAGVGYTERSPDYWELFSSRAGKNAFTDIKNEKTTQLDIGAQYQDQDLKGWVSAYVGKVSDFILFRYSENNNQAHNVDATIMGGEMGIAYQLNDNWKTDASLAYSWAQNATNHRPLPQTPPLEARFGLIWDYGDWTSSGLLRLVNSQHRVAINEGNVVGKDFNNSKGFAILSANTAYKVTKNMQISAGIDNIFDKNYSEHLNLAGNGGFGYSANTQVNDPGRTYWARVNVKF
ncbi:TonB-dependent copper receptor [Xenorhabdus hominickii]|uniref:Outer membrane heme receptor n=1 Tax=Xenorhabdus hominickii TaxID=351679 RepID=A0A2G0Q530_XENHO|nr:TonB-dependent copper receptor [Xenorhabdus hominickii]AOM40046.1 TonB-dependent copper receptor [Xenorhabdus hominickii]PHM51690.1 outer membrane heme receptor [Xenorhabdus hominickii]PHM54323.1 outer membrane heme receptor [Xenorhabdus hominickii]